MKLFRKKGDLYLSDKQPLSISGKILLVITYIILFSWVLIILWPLYQMILSAFNGKQEQYLMLNDRFVFSLKHFKYLFENDDDLDLIYGVLDLIKNYHANGVKLVVASSASMPNIDRIFERFNLNPFFMGKFSGADLKQSKPHPEIFLKAAEHTGSLKEKCMVIEDSTNGIRAAHAADIFCVAFKSEHSTGQDYSKANVIISDFKEIHYDRLASMI